MAVTLQQLFQGTASFRDKIRDTATFGIVKRAAAPGLFGNTLGIEAKFNALTDKSRAYYKTMIAWSHLSYVQTKDDLHPLKIEIFPGVFIYSSKPSISESDVGVRCTCADYYYTWWYYNKQNAGLLGGDLPAYKRKTADIPPRNPTKKPGMCKHLLVLTKDLADNGWLKP